MSHVNIGARADVQDILKKYNSIELSNGTTLEELIRRPELDYDKLAPIDPDRLSYLMIQENRLIFLLSTQVYFKTDQAGLSF